MARTIHSRAGEDRPLLPDWVNAEELEALLRPYFPPGSKLEAIDAEYIKVGRALVAAIKTGKWSSDNADFIYSFSRDLAEWRKFASNEKHLIQSDLDFYASRLDGWKKLLQSHGASVSGERPLFTTAGRPTMRAFKRDDEEAMLRDESALSQDDENFFVGMDLPPGSNVLSLDQNESCPPGRYDYGVEQMRRYCVDRPLPAAAVPQAQPLPPGAQPTTPITPLPLPPAWWNSYYTPSVQPVTPGVYPPIPSMSPPGYGQPFPGMPAFGQYMGRHRHHPRHHDRRRFQPFQRFGSSLSPSPMVIRGEEERALADEEMGFSFNFNNIRLPFGKPATSPRPVRFSFTPQRPTGMFSRMRLNLPSLTPPPPPPPSSSGWSLKKLAHSVTKPFGNMAKGVGKALGFVHPDRRPTTLVIYQPAFRNPKKKWAWKLKDKNGMGFYTAAFATSGFLTPQAAERSGRQSAQRMGVPIDKVKVSRPVSSSGSTPVRKIGIKRNKDGSFAVRLLVPAEVVGRLFAVYQAAKNGNADNVVLGADGSAVSIRQARLFRGPNGSVVVETRVSAAEAGDLAKIFKVARGAGQVVLGCACQRSSSMGHGNHGPEMRNLASSTGAFNKLACMGIELD